MISTGVLVAALIFLSQAFHSQAQAGLEKIKTEKSSKKDTSSSTAYLNASSEAVPQTTSVDIDEKEGFFLADITKIIREEKWVSSTRPVLTKFFRTLFRVVIAPNAP